MKKYCLIGCFILLLFSQLLPRPVIASTTGNNTSTDEDMSIDEDMSMDQNISTYQNTSVYQDTTSIIFKRSNPNSKSSKIADMILQNNLYVNPIWKLYQFTGELTWKEDPYNDQTWRFYFHSLDVVNYLLNGYEKKPNNEYLTKAKWYIESWMAANPSPKSQASVSAWRDHSTANRVVNIIYFLQLYKQSTLYDPEVEEKMIGLLEKHGEFLANDKNYTAGNNHGIFQDRALIELTVLYPKMKNSKLWYSKAMNRLLVHVKQDVTPSGMHKEHSPSYHQLVLNLFRGINKFLIQNGKHEQELNNTIIKMEDYLAYLQKPNGTLPIIGDSDLKYQKTTNPDQLVSEQLKYIVTNGKIGEQPNIDFVSKDGGVTIFRNGWNVENPLYLLFTTAYHSAVHKHADDLSFILSYGKTDFFVDSGKYNYNEQEAYRKYFRSTLAHNTITVDGKSYDIDSKLKNNPQILDVKTSTTLSYVRGTHTLYNGVKVTRTLIYLKKDNSILIHDQIQSSRNHTYTQTFNIGNDVGVKKKDSSLFVLSSNLEKKQLQLIQLGESSKSRTYRGSSQPIAGWLSEEFNKKEPIPQLQFLKSGKNAEYKTVVNCDERTGVKSYQVKSVKGYDQYSIVGRDGKTQAVKIKRE